MTVGETLYFCGVPEDETGLPHFDLGFESGSQTSSACPSAANPRGPLNVGDSRSHTNANHPHPGRKPPGYDWTQVP